eukprot:CAMPEP_0185838110 /NCGR_PEP_ID=MMETSP1353-20130828/12547_1 /TAXON_ID=1077150 /ORGANISM="Erythrolobus australicus, Strain CCMP3124" /LENGTH=58 /DNA_ID=CAMNT_0028537131 /DNA_START=266 /DNA_END=442 /DNA_ORIENTATION=+
MFMFADKLMVAKTMSEICGDNGHQVDSLIAVMQLKLLDSRSWNFRADEDGDQLVGVDL